MSPSTSTHCSDVTIGVHVVTMVTVIRVFPTCKHLIHSNRSIATLYSICVNIVVLLMIMLLSYRASILHSILLLIMVTLIVWPY